MSEERFFLYNSIPLSESARKRTLRRKEEECFSEMTVILFSGYVLLLDDAVAEVAFVVLFPLFGI